ncbi:nitrate reductase molybdenum cofactor assembly chaperone [Vulcanisaeta thermophila]|uniref:nitrate reductase molybdenum cofactor assembly chaperone n=1 Tax=Vulcanisaeta thermophila TaxID=867917 RepID=UPI000852A328|nr:nitrate reductase molybdenum cofactor assembly chaperone [Vulcanisaeta thermophila]
MMSNYLSLLRIIKELLQYPDHDYMERLNEILKNMQNCNECGHVRAFIEGIKGYEIYDLQQLYVKTFDLSPKTNMYITYHIYGNDKWRGRALAMFLSLYHKYGYRVREGELPDNLLTFLDFLTNVGIHEEAEPIIKLTVKAVSKVYYNLHRDNNPYHPLFKALREVLINIEKNIRTNQVQ